jgi:hypothetical protein
MPVTIYGNRFYDWTLLIAELQRLLDESAYTQLLDSPLAEPTRLVMAEWRQQLWDLLHTNPPYQACDVVIPDYPLVWAASGGGPLGLSMPEYEED